MKRITLLVFAILICISSAHAQLVVIYETDFNLRALGAENHAQSGDLSEDQGGFWWNGPRYNDTSNRPGIMVDGSAVEQDPNDPDVNYMRTGSNATITDGVPTSHHFRVTPATPFLNGGKVSITYTVHGGGGAIDIYDMTDGGLLGSVSTDGPSRVPRTAVLDLPNDFSGIKTIGFTRGNGVTYFAWDLKIETNEDDNGDGGDNGNGDDVEPFYMNWNSNPSAFPYDYTVGDITVSIDPVSGSTSTSDPLCGFDESDVVIERRLQTNTLILELNGISMAEFHVAGGSSGGTSSRTIHSVFLLDAEDNEVLISNPDNIYSTIVGDGCGLTGVTGLEVPDGSRVKILFNTSLTSNVETPQNVRVGEMKIVPMSEDLELSDAKEILSAVVPGMESSDIESSAKLVTIKMPAGTDLTAIEPQFSISDGASILPDGPQDFSVGMVVYTVTAENGSTAEWSVSVIANGTVSISDNGKSAIWYVSGNTINLTNLEAGSIVQQIALSGSVVSEGVAYGNNYELPLVSGVQIIRIISNNYVEVIKVTGK
ncbi:hypothetical protein [Alkalitalea saponilacus]|uniref:Uncharacterized protein n=1 Tax=Alkalitalea saponilacus TaxID=889453 RepID=A0A1T5HQT7_9BACT|nr:hypothetical protein [Alkalitalea saponilacus]ASB48444.1 hypothetical protein CDL62_04460 [Alkalitalea saponilacus]SKC22891.1 hypothetical protein SAMN03080601_02609 [Alkalitalea saponilacus]